MKDTISGYVDHIIFQNKDNGYTVFVLIDGHTEITCVGNLHTLTQGESIEAYGTYIEHPSYGQQFQVDSFVAKMLEDAQSIERYLGSGAIKGVGSALAARIVRKFKDATLHIIEEEPERLAEVKGISERKAREISQQVMEKSDMREAMIFLQKYGISLSLAAKIYTQYGQRLYGIIKENPYRMADDITGVGFKVADEIAERIGIQTDSDFRIRSALYYILVQSTGQGNVYLPDTQLFERTSELLGFMPENLEKNLMDLAIEGKVIAKTIDGARVIYSQQLYYLELNIARMLHGLSIAQESDIKYVQKRIQKIEEANEIVLDERQKNAILEASSQGVLIVTGGPGTGKTTTINTMLQFFEGEGLSFALAAPTGRAAKRMTEATGHEASTIHRLLELSGLMEESSAEVQFERNEEHPLEVDVVIIDEMSMVDIYLMHALLCAISVGTRLIMVGDADQLPSVGPGNVLKDLIASGLFCVQNLSRIFRQASESDIVVNAHHIQEGRHVVLDNDSKDFFFLERSDLTMIIRVIVALIQEKLPGYVNAKPLEIQVLTPMRRGPLGVEQLNKVLQKYLNPPQDTKREKEYGDKIFRVGDKVMQIKNNYQMEWEIRGKYGIAAERGIGVFNGDTGIVAEINDFASTLLVEFEDSRYVEYSFKQMDELELAYAITIHKAQGSEYPAVILPLLGGPRMLMNRNLLYTAVTRARKCVTVLGSKECFYDMIDNQYAQKRYSSLATRLEEFFHL
ncbi:MAG: ATP-dependent RecD-like DNA helicase [Lachnospiraceae bacterium]